MSTDPLGGFVGNLQSHNAYAYTLNNPINFADPSGASPCNYINSHAWLGAPNPAYICDPVSNFGRDPFAAFFSPVIFPGGETMLGTWFNWDHLVASDGLGWDRIAHLVLISNIKLRLPQRRSRWSAQDV